MTIGLIIAGISFILLLMIYNHRKKLFIKSHDLYKQMQAEERAKVRARELGQIDDASIEGRGRIANESHIKSLLHKVEYHFDNNEVDDAEACVVELLELSGNDPHIQHQMGIVHIKRHDWEKAEALYKELTKLKLDAKHFVNLGEVLLMQEKLEEALDAYLYGLEMNRDYAENFMQAGYVYEKLGHPKEAKEMYEKAFEIEPENIELRTYIENL
ncbi:MAG: tetratricopeptide repeat protein [Candidatus Peregrinibacteria bacterium]|nr:tetratricopeptide repeat protein [Candidatus Peregrinibacteria bacterium]MDZ4244642.1 tetratricopeptide repeat protein [Candidatus Gracilibacteria bacterium]